MEKSSDAITSQVNSRQVVLLSCGTFSPPTYMHLRMFENLSENCYNAIERARDYLKKIHGWEVVEGIMSPVADSLGRPDIIPAKHRLKMSRWMGMFTRSENCKVRLLLLCGGDVIESITKLAVSDVLLWNTKQIEEVVRDFGVVVVMRANTDPVSAIYLADVLHTYQKNIFVIEDETCPNDISSTRLRTAIRRKESIRYCTSDEVIQYIEDNSLYGATSLPAMRMKLQNICKSASSSNISSSSIIASRGNCLKHPNFNLLSLKQTTEDDNHKAIRTHSLEDKKQSIVSESSKPYLYTSDSLPGCGKVVPKQSKYAHFWSSESPDYHNLTSKSFTASTDWADYFGVKKDELSKCVEKKGLITSQITDVRNERADFQMKMLLALQGRKYEIQTKRRSIDAVSCSVGNLTTEISLKKKDKSRSLSYVRSEERNEESNNVTLIYRKYKLSSTPETTV
uniref:Cytidyltransferase-like domain-containing protein n=1 Tax=Wuchereria bancrofti TaxID=6293 RepID=A0A1I8ESQ3_WUCBA